MTADALKKLTTDALDTLAALPDEGHSDHEYAHCPLHHADDRRASRDTRELEAEAVAFVVGEAVGLDARESSRDSLHLYIYNGDREALAGSLDRIQRAASVILAARLRRRIAIQSAAPSRCPSVVCRLGEPHHRSVRELRHSQRSARCSRSIPRPELNRRPRGRTLVG